MMNKVYRLSLMSVREQGVRQAHARSGRQLHYKSEMKIQSVPTGTWDNTCRTANGMDINGFGQLKDGRGNICPVTIILPTLAMMAKESSTATEEAFLNLLDEKIHEAKDMLIERFDWICSQNSSSAKFMYENNVMEGYDPEEGIKSALRHGTLAMGQIGLAEALQILVDCDQTEEKGMELAKKIEQLFKERCAEFKKHYQLNFGVYYSPKILGLGDAWVTAC